MERNRVLVPLTCVECAEKTLPLVRRFLDPTRTDLILLHVSEKPPEAAALHHRRTETLQKDDPASFSSPASIVVGSQVTGNRRADEIGRSNIPNEAIEPARIAESKRQESAAEYKQIIEELQGNGYRVDIEIRFGSQPAKRILEAAEAERVDLIAMTTHARKGLSRLFSGSVAESVIRGGTIPVLVGSIDSLAEEH